MDSGTLLYLQQNSQNGVLISCIVVSLVYTVVSTLICRNLRNKYYDICASAYIPVVNILIWVICSLKYKFKK